MTTLRDSAKAYESKQTKNVADLEKVPIDVTLHDGEGTDKDGKPFTYKYIIQNSEEYRVPDSVRKALKTILEKRPGTDWVSVTKTGTGFNTDYTVIPL